MGSKRCYISATEAIDKFRNGDLSPVELMQAVVDQAEKVQPTVNAFSHTFFDEAMEQAKQAELRYRDGTARPLEGIRAVSHDGQAIVGYASCLNQVPPRHGNAFVDEYLPDSAHSVGFVPDECPVSRGRPALTLHDRAIGRDGLGVERGSACLIERPTRSTLN